MGSSVTRKHGVLRNDKGFSDGDSRPSKGAHAPVLLGVVDTHEISPVQSLSDSVGHD